MKILFILTTLFLITLSTCSQKIIPGKYVYKANKSYFKIDKNNNYYFSTIGDVHGVLMFSKGKAVLKNDEVTFIPDSSYFLHISVSKYYFDSALKDNRKIILKSSNKNLAEFGFSFNNGSSKSIVDFGSNYSVIYKPIPSSYQEGALTLKANLKDSIVILPRLVHDYIISNTIDFFDVNDDDPNNKPWNVLELNVTINRDMFAFCTLPPYLLKGGKLIEKNCPVYQLSGQ